MTCSTSDVAVCCSSASDSSRVRACTSSNSRTFSIAITAWSAKVSSNSICLSVKARGCCAYHSKGADDRSLAQKRHADSSSDAGSAWLVGAP